MRKHSTRNEKKGSDAKMRAAESSIDPTALPYRASWVDRLIHRIKTLPIPSWLFYPGLLGIMTFVVAAGHWIDGSIPFGRFDIPLLNGIMPIYPVALLAAIQYVDDTALRSFDAFRPALGKSETETARLQYELTTLPAREAWIMAAIGATFNLLVVFFGNYGPNADIPPLSFVIMVLISMLGFIMTAEMLYHTVRQLRLVSHIHRIATQIDLLHSPPLYAFSRLSARTGLIFLVVLYFDLVVNPATFTNPGLLALNFLALPLIAAACFILPIEGMHRRLVLEKQRLQWEVDQRLKASMKQLYERVDTTDLQDADAMNKTISSLIMTRELIAKIPTWPWQPETFTLFFSALTLPVIVFLIQMVLKNLLGFG